MTADRCRLVRVDVIVVGAGIAGIATARALALNGVDVVVLEARDRIGGRTWTDDALGVPVDLGASWILGVDGNPLWSMAKSLDIETVEFSVGSFQFEGRPIAWHDPAGARLTEVPAGAFLADLHTVEDLLPAAVDAAPAGTTYADVVAGVVADLGWGDGRALRVEEYLAHRSEDFTGAPPAEIDAHGLDPDHLPGDQVVFPSGYQQYVTALSDGLDIRTEAVVTLVEQRDDEVRVTTADGSVSSAQHVVVTVPLGVLQAGDVRFDPPLEAPAADAVERLGMGVYDKVFLRFPVKFWDSWVIRQQGAAGSDWHSWYDMSRATGEPVLAALVGGDSARRLERLSDDEVVAEGLAALRHMYGPDVPTPDAVRITRWAADPYTRGSYSYLHVGATVDDHDRLATPSGRVQLAGEATWSDDPATVHGALLSGLRAANRILDVEVSVDDLLSPVA
ncbi:NAD(P)/FAD-dependent oxidoreductase [Curtobacterium sp. VKM Ac-1395]|uniref:flavin monoamine oxidase family protein n=1 Tax=Curtobacterium sp. VKM Ac-1395 TaxID=2783815 RepID=UPI002B277D65|nr:NAD(P)/FAD-dependent oxidoreductase [Curtobacterium sp. VKM Ac-1395]